MEFYHLFFGELAQLLARLKLLRSQSASKVPGRVLAQHRQRRARQQQAEQTAAAGGASDGRVVHWQRGAREWRAVLRQCDDTPLPTAPTLLVPPPSPRSLPVTNNEIRDHAMRLFAALCQEEGFLVTQWSPSICKHALTTQLWLLIFFSLFTGCEMRPRELIELCSVRLKHGRNKKGETLVLVSYEIEPAQAEEDFFSRFFDAFYTRLEVCP